EQVGLLVELRRVRVETAELHAVQARTEVAGDDLRNHLQLCSERIVGGILDRARIGRGYALQLIGGGERVQRRASYQVFVGGPAAGLTVDVAQGLDLRLARAARVRVGLQRERPDAGNGRHKRGVRVEDRVELVAGAHRGQRAVVVAPARGEVAA